MVGGVGDLCQNLQYLSRTCHSCFFQTVFLQGNVDLHTLSSLFTLIVCSRTSEKGHSEKNSKVHFKVNFLRLLLKQGLDWDLTGDGLEMDWRWTGDGLGHSRP